MRQQVREERTLAVRITISLNPNALAEVVADLGLKHPPTFTLNFTPPRIKGRELRGEYCPDTNHINITTNHNVQNTPYAALAIQIKSTLLHELRHAQQLQDWDPEEIEKDRRLPYSMRRMEHDANNYARQNLERFTHLVRVDRAILGEKFPRRLP